MQAALHAALSVTPLRALVITVTSRPHDEVSIVLAAAIVPYR